MFIGVGMVFQVSVCVHESFFTVLAVLGPSHCWYVACLPQVPSYLWYSRHRDSWRDPARAVDRPGSRVGMVAVCSLAVYLDLDRECVSAY